MSPQDILDYHEFEHLSSPELYRRNLYRVLGLAVDGTIEDNQRQQKRLEKMRRLGMPIDESEMSAGIFALKPAADEEHIRHATERFNTPKSRLLDEFFWFWPLQGKSESDPALTALKKGDIKLAVDIWSKDKGKAKIGHHNLAILYHLQALDQEISSANADMKLPWQDTFKYWKKLLGNEPFWSEIKNKVRNLNDKQVKTGFVRRLRDKLPEILLKINGQLAYESAESGNASRVSHHLGIMRKSGFASKLVTEILHEIVEPLRQRIKYMVEHADSQVEADSSHADKTGWQLLDDTKQLLKMADLLLAKDDIILHSIHDDVAQCILQCGITYGNETNDWTRSYKLIKAGEPLAYGQSLKGRYEKNATIVDQNRSEGMCHFCGENSKDDECSFSVTMHGNIQHTYTGIEWNYLDVEIPRCSSCAMKHYTKRLGRIKQLSNSVVRKYSVVSQLISEGWDFGQKPSTEGEYAVTGNAALNSALSTAKSQKPKCPGCGKKISNELYCNKCGLWFETGKKASKSQDASLWYVCHTKEKKALGPFTIKELKKALPEKYPQHLKIQKGKDGVWAVWPNVGLYYPELAEAGLVPSVEELCPNCGKQVKGGKCIKCKYEVGKHCPKCDSFLWDGNCCGECGLSYSRRRKWKFAAAAVLILALSLSYVFKDFMLVHVIRDQGYLSSQALNSKYDYVRGVAVSRLVDQELLAKIAIEYMPRRYSDWQSQAIYESAVNNINNQKLLTKVVNDAKYWKVCVLAIDKTVDQKVLEKVALEYDNRYVRGAAIEKVTDQEVLAKVILESADWEVRESAFKRLTDQQALVKVAIDNEKTVLNKAAFGKITEQDALATVAIESKDKEMRKSAVDQLWDQSAIAKVVSESADEDVRSAAFEKITDQTVVSKMSIESEDWRIRKFSVGKITDQKTLAKVVTEDSYWVVRKAAVEKLTDEKVLAKVALEDENWLVRKAAIGIITDQEVLVKVAKEDTDASVRKAARGKLPESVDTAVVEAEKKVEESLAIEDGISKDAPRQLDSPIADKDWRVRKAKVDTLLDQELIAKVAIADEYWLVRKAAVDNLKLQSVLKKIAVDDENWLVRKAAVNKLTDRAILQEIASGDEDISVRNAAGDRLTSLKVTNNEGDNNDSEIVKLATGNNKGNNNAVAITNEDIIENLPEGGDYTEQYLLAETAMKTDDDKVRTAVFERITNQTVLAKIALEADDQFVRKAAVAKLTVQAVLENVALNDSVWWVRKTALGKVTNQSVLADAAIKDKFSWVRDAAIEKLTNKHALETVVKKANHEDVRDAALKKLENNEYITNEVEDNVKEVPTPGNSNYVRQEALSQVALEDDVEQSKRLEALNNITDQKVLAKVALESEDWQVLKAAVSRLSDQKALTNVAFDNKYGGIREIAVNKLTDQDTLEKVALEDVVWWVRKAAVDKLTDRAILSIVSKNDKYSQVRDAAKKRIREL